MITKELNKWNYRILVHDEHLDPNWYAVHEVYYDVDDVPVFCSENPIEMVCENIDFFDTLMDMIKSAKEKPILNFSDF